MQIIKQTIELFKAAGIHFSAFEITKFLRQFSSAYVNAGDFSEFEFDEDNDIFLINSSEIKKVVEAEYNKGNLSCEFNQSGGYWIYFNPEGAGEIPASQDEDQLPISGENYPNSFPLTSYFLSGIQTQKPDTPSRANETRAVWKESDILGWT